MKNNFRYIILLLSLLGFCFCAVEETKIEESDSTEVAEIKDLVINGQVKTVDLGKDGYVARIQTKNERYAALFSLVNLGGPTHYIQLKIGDLVTIKGDHQKRGNENHLKVSQIIKVNTAIGEPVILDTSFEGIAIGDEIDSHKGSLKKDVLKSSEGNTNIYRINNKAFVVAYVIPDPKDENLVGKIVITSIGTKTKKGIEVGDDYEKLYEMSSSIEVHGSEIEGRTYAKVGHLSYRLDTPNFSYEVDENKIPKNTKIKEIIIQ